MAVWGYARVSTEDQNLGLQATALTEAGVSPGILCERRRRGGRTGQSTPSC